MEPRWTRRCTSTVDWTRAPSSWGLYWSVGGWLLTPHLAQAGPERVKEMRERIVEGRKTTFASRYTQTIGLDEMVDPDVARAYDRKATGEKYLVDQAARAAADTAIRVRHNFVEVPDPSPGTAARPGRDSRRVYVERRSLCERIRHLPHT